MMINKLLLILLTVQLISSISYSQELNNSGVSAVKIASEFSETEIWEKVKRSNNLDDIQDFIDKFPQSEKLVQAQKKAAELKQRIEVQREWDQAVFSGEQKSLQTYIKKYPDSLHRKLAVWMVNRKKQPGVSSSAVRQAIWKQIKDSNNKQMYKAFVRTFPESIEVRMARYKLGEEEPEYLKGGEKKSKIKTKTVLPYWKRDEGIFYIGVGMGTHYFANNDDIRSGALIAQENITTMRTMNVLFEYLWSSGLGIGLEGIQGRHGKQFGNGSSTGSVELATYTGLINAVYQSSIDSNRYSHWGVKLGVGNTGYEVKYESGIGSKRYYSDLTTYKLDAFIDFGGDIFGGRFGGYFMQTESKMVENADNMPLFEQEYMMDASGSGWYVSMRWAF